ncbi:hypothetical protein [Companilactobacillus mishanensis]|uniref:hypothetical protein n=1 Tax=Companilactobacillus mishanensis TaxID=2486008 RepID=UPI001295D2AE|nr:hypothetical protein [Companilactobacillus mishanensis]MQS89679.1 hypothetical protein [Companilactobacillus mishanensis]
MGYYDQRYLELTDFIGKLTPIKPDPIFGEESYFSEEERIDNINELKAILSDILSRRPDEIKDLRGLSEVLFTRNFKLSEVVSELKRLKDEDLLRANISIYQVGFSESSMMDSYEREIDFFDNTYKSYSNIENKYLKGVYSKDKNELDKKYKAMEDIHFEYWKESYDFPGIICDGIEWHLGVRYTDNTLISIFGMNAYPLNYDDLLALFPDYER